VRLIAAARRAVKARPARALALTARHLARFPRGQLAQEREVLAVEALVRLERRAAACARAARLLAAAPHSSYRLRLRGLLGPGECPSPER
jgi:hypothetical protein